MSARICSVYRSPSHGPQPASIYPWDSRPQIESVRGLASIFRARRARRDAHASLSVGTACESRATDALHLAGAHELGSTRDESAAEPLPIPQGSRVSSKLT